MVLTTGNWTLWHWHHLPHRRSQAWVCSGCTCTLARKQKWGLVHPQEERVVNFVKKNNLLGGGVRTRNLIN